LLADALIGSGDKGQLGALPSAATPNPVVLQKGAAPRSHGRRPVGFQTLRRAIIREARASPESLGKEAEGQGIAKQDRHGEPRDHGITN